MSDRERWLRRLGPAALLVLLAVAWLAPGPDWLRLATADRRPAERMDEAIAGLPDAARVLVGFDADLGTYAEIRPTVRALLAALQARGAQLAVVSLTPEGRGLAVAELARLVRRGDEAVGDLGFVAGAEAGLVDLAEGLGERYDAVVVVGGNDLGPRSWVEQVRPRAAVPILAITPAVLLPEVQPYLAGGQLAAALTTPRDGAAWRDGLAPGAVDAADEPRVLAVLVGLLVAAAVLARGVAGRTIGAIRGLRTGPSA